VASRTLLAKLTYTTWCAGESSLALCTFWTTLALHAGLAGLAGRTCFACQTIWAFWPHLTIGTLLSLVACACTILGASSQAFLTLDTTLASDAILTSLACWTRQALETVVTLLALAAPHAHLALVTTRPALSFLSLHADQARRTTKTTRALEALVAHCTLGSQGARIAFSATAAATTDRPSDTIVAILALFANHTAISTRTAQADISLVTLGPSMSRITLGSHDTLITSLSTEPSASHRARIAPVTFQTILTSRSLQAWCTWISLWTILARLAALALHTDRA